MRDASRPQSRAEGSWATPRPADQKAANEAAAMESNFAEALRDRVQIAAARTRLLENTSLVPSIHVGGMVRLSVVLRLLSE
jgi:hypothetical protein